MLKRVNSKIKERKQKRGYSLNDDVLKFMSENKQGREVWHEKTERHNTFRPFHSRNKQIKEKKNDL